MSDYVPLVGMTDEQVADRSGDLYELAGRTSDPVKRQRITVWQEECEEELERRGL